MGVESRDSANPSCLFTRSKLAAPIATGSFEARIPMSGTIGVSLKGEQSQSGVIPIRKFRKPVFFSLPFVAPYAYSTIRSVKTGISISQSISIACSLHVCIQSKHPMQELFLIRDFPSSILIADSGHTSTHVPHPVHLLERENGRALCSFRLSSGGAQAIPRFLIAPPNPETICP